MSLPCYLFLELWQATRFALLNFDAQFKRPESIRALVATMKASPSLSDSWIMNRLHQAVVKADAAFTGYEFANATSAIYNFWLYDLCDVYLVRRATHARAILSLHLSFLSPRGSTYRTCSKSTVALPRSSPFSPSPVAVCSRGIRPARASTRSVGGVRGECAGW